jgi:hypothetical protein
VLLDLAASQQDDPVWANGLLVLRYRRTGAPVPLSTRARLLRRFQVHVRGPATSLVWHTLHRFPQLVPLAKRVVPTRSRSVVPGYPGVQEEPDERDGQPGSDMADGSRTGC